MSSAGCLAGNPLFEFDSEAEDDIEFGAAITYFESAICEMETFDVVDLLENDSDDTDFDEIIRKVPLKLQLFEL